MDKSIFDTATRAAQRVFLRIEEPRVIRVFHFCIYLVLLTVSLTYLQTPAASVEGVLGTVIATNMAAAIAVGGAMGAVAVLPGIWWLERLAIISLVSGMAMYVVALFALVTSLIPVGITVSLILSLALRWIEVRKYQHAPGK